MFESFFTKLSAIGKQEDLKKKIIFTLIMILVARIGTHIPVPGVDVEAIKSATGGAGKDFLNLINMFSGGAFQRASIFALGVMPYINASIIFQLLAVIIPQIEEIQKDGEAGRQKIIQWTRYLTIVIAAVQAYGACVLLTGFSGVVKDPGFSFYFNAIVIFTAGTVFLMWLGEQITTRGIGNGVSIIIMVNILARMPATLVQIWTAKGNSKTFIILAAFIIILIILMTAFIIAFQLAIRKIPIQYVGRDMGGRSSVANNTFLPIKINTAGVLPVIFGSVLLMVPTMLTKVLYDKVKLDVRMIPDPNIPDLMIEASTVTANVLRVVSGWFTGTHPVYLILYAALVMFFTFFYTAIMFDPEKVADNLKKSGGTIPGIRPGKETIDYLERVVIKITWGGAIFLAAIAVLPIVIFTMILKVPLLIGGTAILIIVGVALDTVQQINSQLVAREYDGFL